MTTKFFKETLSKLMLSIGLVCIIIGCKGDDGMDGRDGQPGDTYIAYSWQYSPIYIPDNNPATPDGVYNGVYYETQVGTWEYCYESWDSSIWCGEYTIYRNEGERGEDGGPGEAWWKDGADGANGADGEDICFELLCLSTGSSFYTWNCSSVRAMETETKYQDELKMEIEKMKQAPHIIKYNSKSTVSDKELFFDLNDGDSEIKIETGSMGRYSFKHISKQIK